jgi:putative pyrazinamidase/nicotinamidase
LVALNESKGGFTLLYKGNSIEKDEYSIMQNAESANILSRLIKALKIEQIDVCGLAGDICVLNTAKDLKEVIGDVRLNVLETYSPSLDGGAALSAFVEMLK